ncbi:Zn-dependent hydrolase [Ochrobactrum chromiisoli]|uniref:Zn-dependent hydrolase n=1 Tax=Ochrobactrum chromiisoli TaxID=2993941 RepID=A0ABT3QSU3_9HYPH|nr:Zn-dependent hydrolase [Ochrobactrum chromiisoli]MCX2698691.1 Zn-dependent hydrolase [Ochrobactrum chromiisoli]
MTNKISDLRIDSNRLWADLAAMAEIGPGTCGGNNRQTLTDADRDGRLLFQSWCEAAGCIMSIDSMGNMFARRAGTDPDAMAVMLGSHLDTQPTGGRYDGVLGVLAGLEVVRTLNDRGIQTKRPIEVVNWTNEEGARFAPPMLASGVFAGVYDQEWAYARTDAEGLCLGDELERIGFKGPGPRVASIPYAYLELHIEQGPILEDEGIDIGVVTHGQGLKWLRVTLIGQEAHAGSTPMTRRVNAALGVARITELVERIALDHAPNGVGTVGQMNVHPNSPNIVPGKATLTVDFRHPQKEMLINMEARFQAGVAIIAEDIGLEVAIEDVGGFDPVAFDTNLLTQVREAAEALGLSHRDIVSGAGHDACWINRVAPTAMIFCPCIDGLSHNEKEEISPEWAAAGTNVLLHTALEAAGIET